MSVLTLRTFVKAFTLPVALALTGCGYVIEGRVVQGEMASADWSSKGDLVAGAPVSGATVTIIRDPDRLSRAVVGTALTGADGTFRLAVGGFGAGWMDEEWLIVASARHGGAMWRGAWPSSASGHALIFAIAPGGADLGANPLDNGAFPREDAATILEEVKRYQ